MQANKASINFLLPISFLVIVICACGKKEERTIERGSLRCVQEYNVIERDGQKRIDLQTLNFRIYINGKEFYPDNYYSLGKDVAFCGLSPNAEVELLEFEIAEHDHRGYYILRMENNTPDFKKVSDDIRDNTGCWTNDGRWLLFENYFVNVETGEKKNIKPLPSFPNCKNSLVAISPDMKTVVQRADVTKQLEDEAKDLITLIMTDIETGITKEEKFKLSEYKWLTDTTHFVKDCEGANHLWISNQFKWEKDKNGKDVFVYPKVEK